MVTTSREVERKYDLDADVALPDLAHLPGVARVAGPRLHDLAATYYDTDDLRLAAAGITLRRRTGGDDAGWHLKLPVAGARQELHAPLGRSTTDPPGALCRIVDGVVRGAALHPVADLHTERRETSLLDEHDEVLALVCDDLVQGRRLLTDAEGDGDASSWRECEVELHLGGPKLARAAEEALLAGGATRSRHGSKLGRALGVAVVVPERPTVAARKRTTARELLQAQLARLAADVVRLDPLVRGDVPDAVHQMRITGRRLRGILGTFGTYFDQSVTEPVSEELKLLIQELGRPRDLEVLRERLDALSAGEEPGLVHDDVQRWMDARLRSSHRAAHREAAAAMRSSRYADLVRTLESWATSPPWSDAEDRPARKALRRAVAREWRGLKKAVAAARAARDTEEYVVLLHRVRRAAKWTRYAAEALVPVAGKDASRLASAAASIQGVLGDHHDTAVAADEVVALADAAAAAGLDTFTFGVLRARLDATLPGDERRFERAWRSASKPRVTRWLR